MFSRIVYAARISLTIGIIGIALSFVLALVLGGLAGYYGGWVDNVVQRITEIIKSFPHLPLWLALSAALPVTWSPLLVYFGITIILALLDWPGLGRAVRSKLLSLARGGLRRRRPDDGRQARPHHRPPSAARLHEPSHRLGHAFHPLDDPGRDGVVVPGPGPAPAHHLVGRAA